MAGETVITVVGNLTSDPELRFTQNGLAVANFTVASTPRNYDAAKSEWVDGEALFLRCSVWREFAEHVAGSLTKGSRVIATGRLKQRSYETKEGEKRTSMELEVDEIGPSLRYATATVQKAQSNQNQNRNRGGQQPQQNPAAQQGGEQWSQQPPQGYAPGQPAQQRQYSQQEPWGGQGSYSDETPF